MSSTPQAERWGIVVTAGGSYYAPPGQSYPPPGHPSDHEFDWVRGRVLGAYQLLFVVDGKGRFESRDTGMIDLSAGQLIMLFPDTWHRYQPLPSVGWHEQWIEIRGSIVRDLQAEGIFTPRDACMTCAQPEVVGLLFEKILESLRERETGNSPLAGAWALELLAQLHDERVSSPVQTPIAQAVQRAERLFETNLAEPPSLEKLARKLGIGYSYFRREFKKSTGYSPGQYVRRLRLEKARRLLGASSLPVKAVAEQLGFSSEFHFSAAFKKQFGIAPAHWRKSTRP
ncbi:MAG TPA: AraC family transcriptional regulator [Opitutaceae bacterium]|nr:AraC family transcriptional regulator [Opitutaceae bacterium]